MNYQSTTGKGASVSFREAVISNLPKDGGLFFPTEIPQLQDDFLANISSMSLPEIAEHVLSPFCNGDIAATELNAITKRVFDFPIPLKEVGNGIHALELFHGPTFAFKDIGAKFLAECLAHFNKSSSKETTVLVATSGDTGGAVANGFLGVEGVRVVILYPKGKVSKLQEQQLTTLGQNITALEVEGTFDDCQNMVKQAFADIELNKAMQLSSANSINVARWIPQSLFYYVPLQQGMRDVTFSVPSGNYGNLTSGALAMQMGVPIKSFIAASNANDVVPRYLKSGTYEPVSTIPTIANAMDVSDPSNYKRLQALFHNELDEVRKYLTPFTLSDDAINESIATCYTDHDYLLDPHGAIAYEALNRTETEGVFLETAHYCKFLPVMNEALSRELEVPVFAKSLLEKEKSAIQMNADFSEFKDFLIEF